MIQSVRATQYAWARPSVPRFGDADGRSPAAALAMTVVGSWLSDMLAPEALPGGGPAACEHHARETVSRKGSAAARSFGDLIGDLLITICEATVHRRHQDQNFRFS